MRISMVGLEAAGKTTILKSLQLGEIVTTSPAVGGLSVETAEFKAITFEVWDVGGQDKDRSLWRPFFEDAKGLIFVVDSNDTERLNEAKVELFELLAEDELKEAVLLVFANKQDLPGAMPSGQIAEKMGLHGISDRKWHIQASCATGRDGLFEGLDWLCTKMKENENL